MDSRKSSSPTTSGNAKQKSRSWPADHWTGPVLIVRLSSLGDVVLATSLVELLARRRPDLPIDFLTRQPYDQLLEGLPSIRRVLTPAQSEAGEGSYARVLDLQGGRKGASAARQFAPDTPRSVYRRATIRRRLLVATSNRISGPSQLVSRFAHLVSGMEIGPSDLRSRIAVPANIKTQLELTLSSGDQPQRGWVLISPGASKPLKAIPEALSTQLTRRLLAGGRGVVTLKPPSGALENKEVGCFTGRGLTRSYQGPLPAIAALLTLMVGVFASDSGIMHMASAVSTPVIAVFGPTVPELGFSPLGISRVVGVDSWCRPCHIHGPGFCWRRNKSCWRGHDPDRIVSALDNLL